MDDVKQVVAKAIYEEQRSSYAKEWWQLSNKAKAGWVTTAEAAINAYEKQMSKTPYKGSM